MNPFLRIRGYAVMAVISAFIVLTSGFMLLRIPPSGFGLPVGQIVIIAFLLTFVFDLKHVGPFARTAPIILLVAWWVIGLFHMILGVQQHGLWAIRDGAHWMETSFIWIGFVVASQPGYFATFAVWLRRTFDFCMIYMLFYPLRETLQQFSPKIDSISGYTSPVLFTFNNMSSPVLTGFFQTMIARGESRFPAWRMLVALVSLVFVILLFQARLAYVQFIVVVLLLMALRPQRLVHLAGLGLASLIFAYLLLSMPLQLTGRYGAEMSADFVLNHFMAIWGGGDESVADAARGVDLRLYWWQDIFERVNASISTGAFGLGFGVPLTEFHARGQVLVREVHNSLVSTYGRMGAVGLILFIGIQASIYLAAVKILQFARARRDTKLFAMTATIVCFLVMEMLFAIVEGGFEVSYVAIPYYFLSGSIFALYREVARQQQQIAIDYANAMNAPHASASSSAPSLTLVSSRD